MKTIAFVAVFLFATSLTFAAETLETAKAAFDAGDFRGCLAKLNSAMPPAPKPGTDAKSDPRYEYLLMRGEAQLRLKSAEGAASAFAAAANSAPGDKERGIAAATAGLIKASPNLAYKSGTESIDIVAAESRTKALSLFLETRLKALDASITKAVANTSLNATRSLLPTLREMFAMETGVSGEAKQTSEGSAKLAKHVNELLAKDLTRIDSRTSDLGSKAAKRVTVTKDDGMTTTSINTRQNLVTTEARELQETAKSLQDLKTFIDQGKQTALPNDQTAWDQIGGQIDASISKIEDVLNHDKKK